MGVRASERGGAVADGRACVRHQRQVFIRGVRTVGTFRRAAMAAAFSLAALTGANAMNFTWRDDHIVHASGPIEQGDAAKFAALPKFDILELDSPGGLVGEALAMAENIDARGGIRTVVQAGASCASACAMALFVSGKTRIVY